MVWFLSVCVYVSPCMKEKTRECRWCRYSGIIVKWRQTPTEKQKQQRIIKKTVPEYEIWLRISAPDDRGNDIKTKWMCLQCITAMSFSPLWMTWNLRPCEQNHVQKWNKNQCSNHSIWIIWMNSTLGFNQHRWLFVEIVFVCTAFWLNEKNNKKTRWWMKFWWIWCF